MSVLEEYKEDLKSQLSLKLNSIKGSNFAITGEREKVDYFLNFLAGQNTSINKLISLYYKEIEALESVPREIPTITDLNSKSVWENALLSEIQNFPNNLNDPVDATQTDIFNTSSQTPEIGNTNSIWMDNNKPNTDNDYSTEIIAKPLGSVLNTDTAPVEDEYWYTLETENYDSSYSLLWKTEYINNAIQAIIDTRNSASTSESKDELNSTERNQYTAALNSYITDYSNYVSLLESIRDFDDSELTQFNLTKENLDLTNLNTYLTDLNTYKSYFSTTAGDDIDYDTNLGSLKTTLENIQTFILGRDTSSILGADFNDTDKLYNIRYKILNALAGESQSPLFSWNGLSNGITKAEADIGGLLTKLGENNITNDIALPTPSIISSFYNPTITKDGVKQEEKTGIIISGALHAKEHRVYRKEVTEDNYSDFFSNDDWSLGSYQLLFNEVDEETGNVIQSINDTGIDYNKIYCYRIVSYDNNTSSYTFSSQQSKIYDETEYVDIEGINNGIITLEEENENFISGNFILIIFNDSEIDNFYRIFETDGTKITLEDLKLNINKSGRVYFPKSIVQTREVITTGTIEPPEEPIVPPSEDEDGNLIDSSEYISLGVLKHEWDGTKLRVMDANGVWGQYIDLGVYTDDSNSLINKNFRTLAVGEKRAISSSLLTQTNAVKWIVYIEGNNKYRSFEILALNMNNTSVEYNIYSILGDEFLAIYNVRIIGSQISFEVTNNESFDITVTVVKILI